MKRLSLLVNEENHFIKVSSVVTTVTYTSRSFNDNVEAVNLMLGKLIFLSFKCVCLCLIIMDPLEKFFFSMEDHNFCCINENECCKGRIICNDNIMYIYCIFSRRTKRCLS